MNVKKPKRTDYIKQLYYRYKNDDISAFSAQLTYFIVLSFFPFLLFLLNILSFASMQISVFTNSVIEYLPYDVGVLIKSIITEMLRAGSPVLLSVGAAVAIWSASQGINAIRKGLNRAYDREETRPYWKVRLMALFFTIGIALVILATTLFLISGKVTGEYIFGIIGATRAFGGFWDILRYVIPVAIMLLVFSVFYKFLPSHKIKLKAVLPGALFTTAGWLVISVAFSFYINNFVGYVTLYGSIGLVIIVLLWLHISSMIILVGGEINAIVDYFRSGEIIEKYENIQIKLPRIFTKKKK